MDYIGNYQVGAKEWTSNHVFIVILQFKEENSFKHKLTYVSQMEEQGYQCGSMHMQRKMNTHMPRILQLSFMDTIMIIPLHPLPLIFFLTLPMIKPYTLKLVFWPHPLSNAGLTLHPALQLVKRAFALHSGNENACPALPCPHGQWSGFLS